MQLLNLLFSNKRDDEWTDVTYEWSTKRKYEQSKKETDKPPSIPSTLKAKPIEIKNGCIITSEEEVNRWLKNNPDLKVTN